MASDDSNFCHICGSQEDMTFEHIPPRRCWNDCPTSVMEIAAMSDRFPYPPQRRYRKGMGRRSLCRSCNNRTGDLYGAAFFEWTSQAARYAEKDIQDNVFGLPFTIYPLLVIKQLITMALAAADAARSTTHDYLRAFVMNPTLRHLPADVTIHAYLNPISKQPRAFIDDARRHPIPPTRMSKQSGMLDTNGRPPMIILAEIALPPMGYIFRFASGSMIPDQVSRIPDISHFAHYAADRRKTVVIKLPVRVPVGPSPGHYVGR